MGGGPANSGPTDSGMVQDGASIDGVDASAPDHGEDASKQRLKRAMPAIRSRAAALRVALPQCDDRPASDDPLTFNVDAVLGAMPSELVGGSLRPSAAGRVWATALAVAVLQRLGICWLADEHERLTIVDRRAA